MSIISKLVPILLIEDDEDGRYYPVKSGGYNRIILPSEFMPILEDLKYYCEMYTDEEIIEMNNQLEQNFYNAITETTRIKKSRDTTGYVYLLKCADKYKIGYSKNVYRRIKELDVRPFKLELLFTVYSTNAYGIEQELHKRLELYKETGEWYSNIDEVTVKNMIEEISCEEYD